MRNWGILGVHFVGKRNDDEIVDFLKILNCSDLSFYVDNYESNIDLDVTGIPYFEGDFSVVGEYNDLLRFVVNIECENVEYFIGLIDESKIGDYFKALSSISVDYEFGIIGFELEIESHDKNHVINQIMCNSNFFPFAVFDKNSVFKMEYSADKNKNAVFVEFMSRLSKVVDVGNLPTPPSQH